jgi:hypothetical protein
VSISIVAPVAPAAPVHSKINLDKISVKEKDKISDNLNEEVKLNSPIKVIKTSDILKQVSTKNKKNNSESASRKRYLSPGNTVEFTCIECFNTCTKPILSDCGHYYCFQCSKKLFTSSNTSCQKCRKSYEKHIQPCKSTEDKMSQAILLSFGNIFEPIPRPRCYRNKSELKNISRWCMFFTLENDKRLTARFIKSITYHLHSSYQNNMIKLTEPPFLLSR